MSFDNQLSSQFKDQEDSYNAIILLYDYSYDKEQVVRKIATGENYRINYIGTVIYEDE
ncbi:hypothetical protein PND37_00650 [Lactiplantibacillus plantarum]|jgi:hypothetical protein|uniref:Uncharacterized protein n=2 Tax=Lactiplantibacillus plantarum TaxID=1590 RepID=A0A165DJU1_LACPN|nr:hypothetical protein [Lactiplantibacillus plantarum]ERJ51784.1 hypothetical protein N574_11860 [Lactiplantibacillus plantarum 2165]AGO07038.1 hypothetical protein Lp16_0336 [Lactiplantibacillus plantarum 16]ALC07552.1 hypothetical protein JM48_0337 [Lactiplantibacillus plantarum]ARW34352.1 hypothetical protein S102022_00334 [Lactiplantibacillus plantarum]KZD95508.1 hypothetical protein FBR4_1792 [Lactiplantibacillus plantarum]